MRKILSLSFQPEILKKIKENTKKYGFKSISSYFKYLISMDDDLITEDEILEGAKEAKRDYKNGKLLEANSLDDLLRKYGN